MLAVTGVTADAVKLDACPVAPVMGRLAAACLLPLLRWMSQHASVIQGNGTTNWITNQLQITRALLPAF